MLLRGAGTQTDKLVPWLTEKARGTLTDKTLGTCKAAFLARMMADNDEEAVELLELAMNTSPVPPGKGKLKPQILANRVQKKEALKKTKQAVKETKACAYRTHNENHVKSKIQVSRFKL